MGGAGGDRRPVKSRRLLIHEGGKVNGALQMDGVEIQKPLAEGLRLTVNG